MLDTRGSASRSGMWTMRDRGLLALTNARVGSTSGERVRASSRAILAVVVCATRCDQLAVELRDAAERSSHSRTALSTMVSNTGCDIGRRA